MGPFETLFQLYDQQCNCNPIFHNLGLYRNIYLLTITILDRFKLEEDTNMSSSDHMMLTQHNAPLGSHILTVMQPAKVKITPDVFEMLPKVGLPAGTRFNINLISTLFQR